MIEGDYLKKERINEINSMRFNASNVEMESRFFKNETEWCYFLNQATRYNLTEEEANEITSIKIDLSDLKIHEIHYEEID